MANRTVISQLTSVGESALEQLASSSMTRRAFDGAVQMKDRVEKLLGELVDVDGRIAALEQRVAALEQTKPAATRKPGAAKPAAAAKAPAATPAATSAPAASAPAASAPAATAPV